MRRETGYDTIHAIRSARKDLSSIRFAVYMYCLPILICFNLGTLEVSQNSEVAERASLARDELFEGSRVEPAPIISTNPFVESNTASDDDDDMPPPLIEINDHGMATFDFE